MPWARCALDAGRQGCEDEAGLETLLFRFLFSGPDTPVRCGRNESWIRTREPQRKPRLFCAG